MNESSFIIAVLISSWQMLLNAAIYILFGIIMAGLLKMFISPDYVVRHLGCGRFSSVVKAALLGIPLPLCSCGVLPTAAALRKQGANNGATTAFLIATPESGIDSIAISCALLDPILTVVRPLAAFLTAVTAGFAENLCNPPTAGGPDRALGLPILKAACCDDPNCADQEQQNHGSIPEKIKKAMGYAFGELWGDLAGWFFLGLLLAGLITTLLPATILETYLGGGLTSMLLMLIIGVPLYMCATCSTPIAAAFIMKGVSPGAALVFLLSGPATNITSLFVVMRLLGRRATALYLAAIALVSVLCGLAVDLLYLRLGIRASATVGQAAELIPEPLQLLAAIFLAVISIRPVWRILRARFTRNKPIKEQCGCGCSSNCGSPAEPASFQKKQ